MYMALSNPIASSHRRSLWYSRPAISVALPYNLEKLRYLWTLGYCILSERFWWEILDVFDVSSVSKPEIYRQWNADDSSLPNCFRFSHVPHFLLVFSVLLPKAIAVRIASQKGLVLFTRILHIVLERNWWWECSRNSTYALIDFRQYVNPVVKVSSIDWWCPKMTGYWSSVYGCRVLEFGCMSTTTGTLRTFRSPIAGVGTWTTESNN